jgi:hypothetical protein
MDEAQRIDDNEKILMIQSAVSECPDLRQVYKNDQILKSSGLPAMTYVQY